MSVGQAERTTQNRIIRLFRDELGYRYLGDWCDRTGNSNIEEDLLSSYLTARGYSPAQISAASHTLRAEADNHSRRVRPDGWRGVLAREQVIKQAIFGVLKDAVEVERIS